MVASVNCLKFFSRISQFSLRAVLRCEFQFGVDSGARTNLAGRHFDVDNLSVSKVRRAVLIAPRAVMVSADLNGHPVQAGLHTAS